LKIVVGQAILPAAGFLAGSDLDAAMLLGGADDRFLSAFFEADPAADDKDESSAPPKHNPHSA